MDIYTINDFLNMPHSGDVNLRANLDFNNQEVFINNSLTSLKFNGNGFTIKNIKNDGNGIFNRLQELRNLKVENVECTNMLNNGIIMNNITSTLGVVENLELYNLSCTTIGNTVGAIFGGGTAVEVSDIFIDGLDMLNQEGTTNNRTNIGLFGGCRTVRKMERIEVINFNIEGNLQSAAIFPYFIPGNGTTINIRDIKIFGNFYAKGLNTSNSRIGMLIGQLSPLANSTLNIENVFIKMDNVQVDNNTSGTLIGQKTTNNGTLNVKNCVVFVDQFYNENTRTNTRGMLLGGTIGFNSNINTYFNYNSNHNNNIEYPFTNIDRTDVLNVSDMKNQSFFESLNFDFSNIWKIGEDGYPTLTFRFPPPTPIGNSIYIKINGVWRESEKAFLKINGIWKEVDTLSLKINGEFK